MVCGLAGVSQEGSLAERRSWEGPSLAPPTTAPDWFPCCRSQLSLPASIPRALFTMSFPGSDTSATVKAQAPPPQPGPQYSLPSFIHSFNIYKVPVWPCTRTTKIKRNEIWFHLQGT